MLGTGDSPLRLGTDGDRGLVNPPAGAGEPPRRSTDGDVSPIPSTGFFSLSSSSSAAGGLLYSRRLAPSKGLVLSRSAASTDLAALREEAGLLGVGSLVSLLTLNKR